MKMTIYSLSFRMSAATAAALVFFFAFTLILAASPAAAGGLKDFSVKFGKADDRLMYYNHTIEGFEEPYPMGPSDFCVTDDDIVAVLDTFNNSVKVFGADSRLLECTNLLELAKKELATAEIALSGLAFVKYDASSGSEFYACDAISSKIFRVSGKKLIGVFGGRGEKEFQFKQLEQLFRTPDGRIIACDYAQNKAALFTADGKGIREFEWNLCSIYADSNYIYSINPRPDKSFAFYRQRLDSGMSEHMFTLAAPSFRIAKIIGVDKAGNAMAAFFDDSVQPELMRAAGGEYPAGYYTVAVFTANGRMVDQKIVPVCAPLGNQFYFNASSNKAYYQNYNAWRAPAGDYKITVIEPGFAAAAAVKKVSAETVAALKKAVTRVEYGDAPNKLSGGFEAVSAKLPVIRCDKDGYFYLLDRTAGKVLCVDEAFANIRAIEVAKNIGESEKGGAKKGAFDFCDLFAVSSCEIYLLDSKNGEYYCVKSAPGKGEAAYDVKIVSFDEQGVDKYDRIFANAIGDVILYSSVDGGAILFDENGGEKKFFESFGDLNFFVLPNSDALSLVTAGSSNEVKLNYMDFYGNIMKRFEKTVALKSVDGGISSAAIIGADRNLNVFLAYGDAAGHKIAIFAVTGDRVCEFDLNAPALGRYFDASVAVGANGTIYLGMPAAESYNIFRIPYASVIEHITKK